MWVALLAGAAYLAYEYLLAPNASASTVLAAASPASTGTPTSNPVPTAVTTPPLGTQVTTEQQASLQSAANYPYIIYGGALVNTSPPSNYQLLSTQDLGNIWVRNDVASAVQAYTTGLQAQQTAACAAFAATAPPGTPCPAPSVPSMTLAQVQSIMKSSNLSGLGLMGLWPMYQRMGWN